MWNLFKIVNFFWLMASTYIWVTSLISMTPILVVVNALMMISLGFLPVRIELTKTVGRVAMSIVLLAAWSIVIDGPIMGIVTLLSYMPVIYLLFLPAEYLEDLLGFCTKWYAILLGGALVVYLMVLTVGFPKFGRFVHPNYEPYDNYLLYIKTTYDYGTFERFNAFFLEPGHQALLSSFLMLANKYNFKQNPYLYILGAGVIFSFSLAGYLLTIVGFTLTKINSVARLFGLLSILTLVVVGILNWNGGDNAVNELILGRLEYDESKGIKGNNRYFNNTDDEFTKAFRNDDAWIGVKNKANMDLIGGAGYKIYILKFGIVGVILALLLYLSLIPPHPDFKYTVVFLIVLSFCFVQRAYPTWYSWLFPYVTGIYIARYKKYGQSE